MTSIAEAPALRPKATLPADALDLLGVGKMKLQTALAFLGIGKTHGYNMAKAYARRTAGLRTKVVYDPLQLRPRVNPKTGAWLEIPCWRTERGYNCHAEWIVAMRHPEIGWPI